MRLAETRPVHRVRESVWRRLRGTRLATASGVALHGGLVLSRSPKVVYVGWIGRGNLGDAVILDVYRRRLPDIRFDYVSEQLTRDVLLRMRDWARFPVRGILVGGGTVVGQRLWRPQLERLLDVFTDVPVYATGVGVEDPDRPHSPDNTDELARWRPLLERFTRVSVRGAASQAMLARIGIDAPVVGDTALMLRDARPPAVVRPRLLGLNISHPPGEPSAEADAVVDVLIRFGEQMAAAGWAIRLFEFNPQSRRRVASRLDRLTRSPSVQVIRPRHHLDRALRQLAECQVFVGHRLHSAVLATAMDVPVVTVDYRPKCAEFMASIGQPSLAVAPAELRVDRLVSRCSALADERTGHVAAVRRRVDPLVARLTREIDGFGAAVRDLPRR